MASLACLYIRSFLACSIFGLAVLTAPGVNPAGDLKLVEKPSPLTLAPHVFANIKANVKVASTENGIIFGNIGKAHPLCLFSLLPEISGFGPQFQG